MMTSENSGSTPRFRKTKGKLRVLRENVITKNKLVKNLQNKSYRQAKKIGDLEELIKKLHSKNLIDEETSVILSSFSDVQQEIVKRLNRKRQKKSVSKELPSEFKMFALTLHFYSPKAYRYVRTTLSLVLPSPSTISKWYSNIDLDIGFTKDSFKMLNKLKEKHDFQLVCSIVNDEMSIREKLDVKGSRHYGYTDYGFGSMNEKASKALVFLVVFLNIRVKLPIGFFLTKRITGQQLHTLIESAFTLVKKEGISIASTGVDAAHVNVSALKLLGANPAKFKSTFDHEGEEHVINLDMGHCFKNVRKHFHENDFLDDEGNITSFSYITRLYEFQEATGFHLANKLTKSHIFFEGSQMKVKLATQIFSESVAVALDFCREDLKLEEFQGSAATSRLCRMLNTTCDLLNSRGLSTNTLKSAINQNNAEEILKAAKQCINYIASLKTTNGRVVVGCAFGAGFFGLIVDLMNIEILYKKYVLTNILDFIPMYRTTTDHIEQFFGFVRAGPGANNNPSALIFEAIYKKLLWDIDMQKISTGNTVQQEEIKLLSVSSSVPKTKKRSSLVSLNALCKPKKNNASEEEQHDIRTQQYIEEESMDVPDIVNDEFSAVELVDFMKKMSNLETVEIELIIYIAGFIVFRLSRQLKCTRCVEILTGNVIKSNFLALKRATKKLEIPSDIVVAICTKAEEVLKAKLHQNENFNRAAFETTVEDVTFSCTSNLHNLQHDDETHSQLLLDIVIQRYLKIRFVYLAKKSSEKVTKRQHHTKLVQFIESTGSKEDKKGNLKRKQTQEEVRRLSKNYILFFVLRLFQRARFTKIC